MINLKDVNKLLSGIIKDENIQFNHDPVKHLSIFIESKNDILNLLHKFKEAKVEFIIQSQGKNWGYTFIKDNSIIINLSKLNSIIEFNEELGYITVEPGVTFDQVYTYLQEHKSSLMMGVTGGSPMASVIGTTLERGIGKGIQGNLFEFCCGFEVVLPSGKVIKTGLSKFKNNKAGNLYKWGVGSYVDGLFSQSNYGIVTKMTILLHRKPNYQILCTFSIKDDMKLANIINEIRFLKQNDILKGNFLIGNQYRFLTELFQYPWKETNNKTPLPKKVMTALMKKAGIDAKWTGQFMINGFNKKIAYSHLEVIQSQFKKYIKSFESISATDIILIKKGQKKVTKKFEKSVFDGYPNTDSLKSLYWRKKIPVPPTIDPVRDKCGVIWFNAVIPIRGSEVTDVSKKVEKIMSNYSFEPNIGFNFITDRVVYLIGVILYDKELVEEHSRAINCNREISKVLFDNGYFPYRKSSLNTELPKYYNDDSSFFYDRLEKIFDF